jgi:hypothetical protein
MRRAHRDRRRRDEDGGRHQKEQLPDSPGLRSPQVTARVAPTPLQLASWKQEWKNTQQAERGKAYIEATQDRPRISYKMQPLAGPKRVQATYYQLKRGKGFFRQSSKAIDNNNRGECFGVCKELQTPEHLLLHCQHYAKERRKMTEALDIPVLTLHLLFTTARGRAALVAFLEKTKIVSASWLLATGGL